MIFRSLREYLQTRKMAERAFHEKSPDGPVGAEYISGASLLTKASFRIPEHSVGPLSILGAYLRMVSATAPTPESEGEFKALIWDDLTKNEALRSDYIASVQGEAKRKYLSRESLRTPRSGVDRWGWAIGLMPLTVKLFFTGLRAPERRGDLILQLIETMEGARLLQELSYLNTCQVYFFGPYQRDANLLTLLFNQKGFAVCKHPSPGPLVGHNRLMLADTLALCSGYQEEEFPYLQDSMLVADTQKWPPEFVKSYDTVKLEEGGKSYPLGFFSHAGWLRKAEGKGKAVFARHDTEEELIRHLGDMLRTEEDAYLLVCPHPKEKKPEVWTKTEAYYGELLPENRFEFLAEGLRSIDAFSRVDTGVCSYSSILFERLSFGLKTIVYTERMENFPLPGTRLAQICANSPARLKALYHEIKPLSAEDFFSHYQLESYRQFGSPQKTTA